MLENENNELQDTEPAKSPEEVLADLQTKIDNDYVPKSEAEMWKQKYYKSFQDRANGVTAKPEEKPNPELETKQFFDTVNKLGTVTLGKGKSAHDHVEALLAIRKFNLEHGKEDIFPYDGEEMAKMMQSCLDLSGGDDRVLMSNIQSRLDFSKKNF